jgi:hypothetical protein
MSNYEIKASEFIANAKKYLGWKYIYAAKGGRYNETQIKSFAKLYPNVYTTNYLNKTLKNANLDATDCSGLLYLALNKKHLLSSLGFYDVAKITTVKDAPIGAALYKLGHIGIKISDTEHIESRGVDYGVVIKPITSQAWTCGLVFDFMEYDVGKATIQDNNFDNLYWSIRLQAILNYNNKDNKSITPLIIDGNPGAKTLDITPTLSKNSSGYIVSLIQEKLIYKYGYDLGKYGIYKDGVDGEWGSKMNDVVLDFQKNYVGQANPDGIITGGKSTWKKLLEM